MPFESPPDLPPFIERQLSFRRRVFRLESGADRDRAIHFIDEGDPSARPVLMLHGNPTWSFLWRKVIAKLPEFRCVAPDLLGLGFSDKLPRLDDHSLDRHADTIAGLVVALDLRDAILVAQDWGGPIGVCTAARQPDRFAGVVLANTSVLLSDRLKTTWFHRFSRMPGVSDLVFRGFGFPQIILHRVQGDRSSIRGEVARAYQWPLRTWSDRVAPLAMGRMVPSHADHPTVAALEPGSAWIKAFESPIELVWGLRDPILGRTLGRHERTLTGATVTRTEAGHFLQEEVPEELAAAVRRITET